MQSLGMWVKMSGQKVKIKVGGTVPPIFPWGFVSWNFFLPTVLYVRDCGNLFVYDQSSP